MPETTRDGPGSGPVGRGWSSERVDTVQDVGGRGYYQPGLAPWSPTVGHCPSWGV